ncbi:malonate decarboxylase subunit delta [Aquitalea sp. LB_tupeE]|uniref:malonate decarboxylase subunit delta n=1 Tax=Aquitalea sp. LB_tupeE TaxID=2748078 RepID=UPI0015B8CD54|nr:malonate decarboxylase subunit delta [Aquitalea sp. LB_tupeE]NWK79715.1 malonate decarboxylase subunit delta [Aquitalea sp. LB_tupeE]
MEKLHLEYPAGAPATQRVLVGVVASGDLEILITPAPAGRCHITIHSAADGSATRWRAQLERLFADGKAAAMQMEINDFAATPGVISLRLAQALEELSA